MQEGMQEIKKSFFTFRNGILADTLRKAGMPYRMIFGLQIPQIAAIARGLTPSMELADRLWADSDVRESRILATYLFPPEETTMDKALELLRSVCTAEESDMLSFRLLKRLPFAAELLAAIEEDPAVPSYAATSLRRHLQ